MEGWLVLRCEVSSTEAVQYYAEVTPTMGMLLISAHIFDPFQKLRFCWKWDKGMDINPEDETSYTTQYPEALLIFVYNE